MYCCTWNLSIEIENDIISVILLQCLDVAKEIDTFMSDKASIIISQSMQGLTKGMEAIVEVRRAFVLIVTVKKTETMCMPPPRTPRIMVRVDATGRIYKEV